MTNILWLFLPIVSLTVLLAAGNVTPGSWLTGWDNIHPEFNFPLNITRSLFAAWQEYQGPGLLGGMGHAAALPRELLLWILSLLIPVDQLRYLWTFLMLGVGALGASVLIRRIARTIRPNGSNTTLTITGLSGGLFYLFNLATVQTFFAPFEAFVTHFAVLPWLLWSTLRILEKPSVQRLAVFAVINLLGATHAYIPTLFFVYLSVLAILLLWHVIRSHSLLSLRRVIVILLITFTTNAFWLLPFGYFAGTGTTTTVDAKINQMATEDIYLRNQKYGTIGDTLALKNFWFDNVEYNPISGTSEMMMDTWRDWGETPGVIATSSIVIGIVLVGAALALRKKETIPWFFIGLAAFTMIAIDAPPFSQVITVLRDHIPLFSQFLRFPFTKWATTLSLVYAVFFSLSFLWLLSFLRTRHYLVPVMLFALVVSLPVITTLPVFSGNLISERVRIAIPDEYFSLFDYFRIKPQGRVAVLPQPNFWDWRYYRWGALGSGFIWYGIEQPILDRSFDVWSSENENVYWELSYALFSKNPEAIDAVINKYDVSYIVLDNNLVTTSHSRALFTQESESLLPILSNFNLDATFGNILVYTRIVPRSDTFIQVTDVLPTVSSTYTWTDSDIAFQDIGMYESGPIKSERTEATYYPFRSLFTKRNAQELPYPIHDDDRQITISSPLPSDLVLQAQEPKNIFSEAGQNTNPYATLTVSDTDAAVSVDKTESLVYSTDDTGVFDPRAVFPCGLLSPGVATGALRNDGTEPYLELSSLAEQGCLSFGMPDLHHSQGYLAAVTYRHGTGRPLLLAFINQSAKHTEIETHLTRNTDWTTDYFILPPLSPDGLAYTVYLANDAKGRYKTVNDIESIRVYRFPYDELVRLSIPQHDQDISKDIKEQQLSGSFTVSHPNPSYYRITLDEQSQANQTLILNQSYHEGWRAYEVECKVQNVKCKIAEIFPFLFGQEIKNHVLVNNWANAWLIEPKPADQAQHEPSTNSSEKANAKLRRGWLLPSNEVTNNQLTIVIFFLPQLLQWIGFALLPVPFVWVFLTRYPLRVRPLKVGRRVSGSA